MKKEKEKKELERKERINTMPKKLKVKNIML